ncbi:hypothetical protein AC579_4228 [Pseudocercospora musae]|uniref:Uncharacterized protein n=1 Tax=Pseudocercospora musae TaxID=113226 RepID=A0A139ICY6_9PEZI|nr:hypothetical protein AC579_4228 [Pseudocercospora musae]
MARAESYLAAFTGSSMQQKLFAAQQLVLSAAGLGEWKGDAEGLVTLRSAIETNTVVQRIEGDGTELLFLWRSTCSLELPALREYTGPGPQI